MNLEKKYAFRTVVSHVLLQIILSMTGLLIPKIILSVYGSTINGLTNSITQFLTYIALVEAGVGDASVAALYKPLAQNNFQQVNCILSLARKKYVRAGLIYVFVAVVFSAVYAGIVRDEVSFDLALFMVLAIALSYAVDYLLIGKYKVLLIAEQKYFILNFFKILAAIITLIASASLLLNGYSIIVVKFSIIFIRVFEAAGIAIYTRKKYAWVNYREKTGAYKLQQQINAMIHQICSVVIYNTDLVVLTLCLSQHALKEISVYTVYAMAVGVINCTLVACTNGISAYVGNLKAKGELSKLQSFFDKFEFGYFVILFLLYTCYAVLVNPFVACYTRGITDVQYNRPFVAILFTLCGVSCQIHDPGGVLIRVTGSFRETQKYILAEAVINIIISIIMVFSFGITGVLVGTFIGHIIADIGLVNYSNKKILQRTNTNTLVRIARNSILMMVILILEFRYLQNINQWVEWIVAALLCTVVNGLLFGGVNLLCERFFFYEIKNQLIKRKKYEKKI